mmetsp:Transcript_58777/g.120245  ORF Transcript_58777/g.120245 Transcript_58777/m.120245 type:complete len:225 (+) Transcript_58777:1048-1722(+)
MTRLTQRSCTGFRGIPNPQTEPMNDTSSATTFTLSWNWRKRRMLSYTDLPHSTDFTIEEKLSSMITMSEASCATAVPAIPIDNPTSASLSAGASLVPSPVTATTSPISLRRRTRINLSWGLHLAMTCRSLSTDFCSSGVILRKSGPSTADPVVRMPHSFAILLAVSTLSPVTMRTMMPAFWQDSTAAGTSLRRGSLIPTIPMHVISTSGGSSSFATASGSVTSL